MKTLLFTLATALMFNTASFAAETNEQGSPSAPAASRFKNLSDGSIGKPVATPVSTRDAGKQADHIGKNTDQVDPAMLPYLDGGHYGRS